MGTDQEGAVRCGELADNFEANDVVGVGDECESCRCSLLICFSPSCFSCRSFYECTLRDMELSLGGGPDNYLVHIHIGGLLDRERNSAGDGIRRHRELVLGTRRVGFSAPDLSQIPRSSSGRSRAK